MALVKLEVVDRSPYEGGQRFGDVGPYERIDAIAHYAVDPKHRGNTSIVDLGFARPGEDGLVHFSGDATFLLPMERDRANGALLVEVPNRGNRVAIRSFNMAPFDLMPTERIDPGDGFLFERGWAIAWCGWQWDMPSNAPRLGLRAPEAKLPSDAARGQMQLRIQPDERRASFSLTDHHVGSIGNHRPIAAARIDDGQAVLWVRGHLWDEPTMVPREHWQFARDENGAPLADDEHIWLSTGFEPGRIYDIVYTPAECPVVGAGLLAFRDFASYLRHDASAPTAGLASHVIGEGISQCGRFLRTFLHLGLNLDEQERQVFDGLLVHIAGGRRGEFNHRYGQPSVQPTPSFGHLFPFADEPQHDERTCVTEGLLDRQRRTLGGLPKIFYTDTSSEYWRGDAALSHLDVGEPVDVEPPDDVRRYLFACTQHGPGALPFSDRSMFGSRGSNYFNIVDYRPLFRAALCNLLDWVARETEPPKSVFPRHGDNTASDRAAVIAKLATIPGCALPDAERLLVICPIELGTAAEHGVGEFPAKAIGPAYPAIVSDIGPDGNETGGVAMPDVSVPVATHLGFNPRHPTTGGDGQVLEYVGSTVPFSRKEDERRANGDPRPSISERYRDRDDYLEQVRAAANALVQRRLLLDCDVEVCIRLAAQRYDACMR